MKKICIAIALTVSLGLNLTAAALSNEYPEKHSITEEKVNTENNYADIKNVNVYKTYYPIATSNSMGAWWVAQKPW